MENNDIQCIHIKTMSYSFRTECVCVCVCASLRKLNISLVQLSCSLYLFQMNLLCLHLQIKVTHFISGNIVIILIMNWRTSCVKNVKLDSIHVVWLSWFYGFSIRPSLIFKSWNKLFKFLSQNFLNKVFSLFTGDCMRNTHVSFLYQLCIVGT